MPTVMETVLEALNTRPYLSHDLYDQLKSLGHARPACASAVHRLLARSKIERLDQRLRHGRAILVGHDVQADAMFMSRLRETRFGQSPGPDRVLTALGSTHGSISAADAAKLASLDVGEEPEPNLKAAHDLMRAFERLGIVTSAGRHGAQIIWGANDQLLHQSHILRGPRRSGGQTATTALLLRYRLSAMVGRWLFENGWVSKAGVHHSSPEHPIRSAAGLGFDVVAFSHLRPIRRGEDQPRIVVGDVDVVGYDEVHVDAFLDRLGRVKARLRQTPLAFVLCRSFEPTAFARLKEAGVLPWTINQFFNPKVGESVIATLELAQSFARAAQLDPDLFERALAGASQYGQLFGDIRGRLFEFIVAQLLAAMGVQNVRLGRVIGDENFDVDVSGNIASRAWIVECKGWQRDKEVPFGEVRQHFTKRVPAYRDWARDEKLTPVRSFNAVVVATCAIQRTSESGRELPAPRFDTTHEIWSRDRLIELLQEHDLAVCKLVVEQHY